MPVIQGSGAFSIGRDCTLVVVHSLYGRFDLPNVTGFDAKQLTASVRVDRLDGTQLSAELPKGWTGSFDVERGGAGVDMLFAQIEAGWLNSGVIGVTTIYQYIAEPNGSSSTFQFDNCSVKLDEAGAWKGDASVKQHISFMANRRRPV